MRMILDLIIHAEKYYSLGKGIEQALKYLSSTDFSNLEKGKHEIIPDKLYGIINEYDTVDASMEQMESHKKFIDVQFIVSGEELIGHDFLHQQTISKEYDPETDFMLYTDLPKFFSKLTTGMFAIFYPTDLHMPNLKIDNPLSVKKVVMKVSID